MNLYAQSLESFFKLIADIFLLIVIIIFLAFINLKIILIAMLLFFSTFMLLKITITKKIKQLGIDYNRSLSSQFIKIKDFFTGIQSIKLFDQVSNHIKNIDNFAKSVYLNSLKRNFYT
jgi:ABC-type bacteriocin/lantibiotic exporter with double-glycine peptidase domain